MKFSNLVIRVTGMFLCVGFVLAAQAAPSTSTNAANKAAVVGATSQEFAFAGFVCDELVPPIFCEDTNELGLMSDTVKAPTNGDYAFHVSMECFVGSYDIDSSAPYGFGLDYRRAYVEVWVVVDGVVVNGDEDGKVIFCGQEVLQLYANEGRDDLNVELQRFGGTYAFNWFKLNLTQGTHLVEVKAKLAARVLDLDLIPDEGTVAVVGKRSLIIEPIKVKIDETIDQAVLP
jgi:hypothetical protein